MDNKKSLCVFCGASDNVSEDYLSEGRKLGKMIAERKAVIFFITGKSRGLTRTE